MVEPPGRQVQFTNKALGLFQILKIQIQLGQDLVITRPWTKDMVKPDITFPLIV